MRRHGARIDAVDKEWHLTSPTPYDPPLTYGGWIQGRALGARIASLLKAREDSVHDETIPTTNISVSLASSSMSEIISPEDSHPKPPKKSTETQSHNSLFSIFTMRSDVRCDQRWHEPVLPSRQRAFEQPHPSFIYSGV